MVDPDRKICFSSCIFKNEIQCASARELQIQMVKDIDFEVRHMYEPSFATFKLFDLVRVTALSLSFLTHCVWKVIMLTT